MKTTHVWKSLPQFITDCSTSLSRLQEIPGISYDLFIQFYLFRAQTDCVKHPCSSLGRIRRYNFIKLHYITSGSSVWQDIIQNNTDIPIQVKRVTWCNVHKLALFLVHF